MEAPGETVSVLALPSSGPADQGRGRAPAGAEPGEPIGAHRVDEQVGEENWDRLLEWMTHVGSGPWEAFRQAVDELDQGTDEDRSALYRSLRIALSDLGHVDFFIGGSRRWRARRPALVGTSVGEREHVFTGGRNARRVSELAAAARNAEAAVTFEQDHPGLSRVDVEGDPARLAGISQHLGIDYVQNGAATLAALLPSLRNALEASKEAEEPIGWDVRSWSFDEARWVGGRLNRSLREYRNRHGVRRYLLNTERGKPLREVEKRMGIYCMARARNQRLISYSAADQTLRMPRWAPLPAEHARVACLAGGRLGSLTEEHIVFSAADWRTASTLLASLGQGVPMPRTFK